MKVLVATSMYPSDERPYVGTFVRTQVEALRRAGIDVDVFVIEGRKKVKYATAIAALRRRLRTEKYDLVHAHYSYVGFVARMQRRVPVVVTFHGSDLLGEIWDDSGKITGRSRIEAFAASLLGSFVDAAIVQTPEMARKLRRANAHIVPHEVDLDLFRPYPRDLARRELGLSADARYVLFAASPDLPVKRHSLAVSALSALAEDGIDAELLTVHDQTQERLALYMSASDALIFPSFLEGSPNVVKQAMACNLPVVATDVGDIREVIGSTAGCHVCDPTSAALSRALRDVLLRPRRTDGRTRVQKLAPEVVAGRIVSIYESVVASHRAVGAVTAADAVGEG